MNKQCKECAPGISCLHIGKETGPEACPWYKPAPGADQVPRGSCMDLTITNCDEDGHIDARMRLRLLMHYTKEDGVLYEIWDSPDCPLPQPMIAEILTFLEDNGYPPGPSADGRFVRKAELPASLIAKLMGPSWMSRFRQITNAMKQRQITDAAQQARVQAKYTEAEIVPPEQLPYKPFIPGAGHTG